MTPEQNELITRVGPGTKCGALMRHYWHPVALADELPDERPAKAVRVLGQDFVLFRDERGRHGLLDRDCPHRGADLAYGRLEDGGLRCLFHGWLFDVDGKCLETPAEPEGSVLCQRVRQRSYPVVVKNGIVFAWLGEGEAPAFPDFDCFLAPGTHAFAFKGLIDCNWLQALEVGIDPAHASYLHRFYEDEDPSGAAYGKQFRANSADSNIPMSRMMREFTRPTIDVEGTDYGLRLFTLRKISEKHTHVRVTNLVFPYAFVIPMSTEMTITQWHVPIDDTSCYWYAIFTSFGEPVDHQQMREQRLQALRAARLPPAHRPPQQLRLQRRRAEDARPSPAWASTSTSTTSGRSRARAASRTARASISAPATRRSSPIAACCCRRSARSPNGGKPPMWLDAERATQGPRARSTVDGMGPTVGWEDYWKEFDAKRRRSGRAGRPRPARRWSPERACISPKRPACGTTTARPRRARSSAASRRASSPSCASPSPTSTACCAARR